MRIEKSKLGEAYQRQRVIIQECDIIYIAAGSHLWSAEDDNAVMATSSLSIFVFLHAAENKQKTFVELLVLDDTGMLWIVHSNIDGRLQVISPVYDIDDPSCYDLQMTYLPNSNRFYFSSCLQFEPLVDIDAFLPG